MPQTPEQKFRARLTRSTNRLAAACPVLGGWIAEYGRCDLQVRWDISLYQALVQAIAHQQLHGAAAATMLRRLQEGFPGDGFPEPQLVARASLETLRGMGFSNAKAIAIHGVASAAVAGEIPTREVAESWSDDELIAHLTKLRGIGRWTVEMLLIFTLGRLDVMPVDDFGVRSGLLHLLALPELPRKAEFALHTDHWAPYRSIGAWYLWRRADAAKLKPASP